MNPTPSDALTLHGLRMHWPGATQDLLDIPALAVQRGERVLLRGDSGCGKSTLLALAAGVLMPQAGQVQLLGVDWRSLSAGQRDRRRADHIGYIFQQFNLLPYLSALDNVLLPCRFSALRARRCGPQAGAMQDTARRLLAALQLEPALWLRRAGELSVGQQQRVAAARALIGQPELVIADEPTSALDETRRDTFMALLLQVCAEAGSALLFVSHDPRLATHFSRVLDLPTLNRATGTPSVAATA